jgi:lipopolysaccharide/colanic/teichoic acid biosynthesis glycosyltransferase
MDPSTLETARVVPVRQVGTGARRRARVRERRVLVATLVLSDAVTVAAALLLAWYLRIGSGLLSYSQAVDLAPYLQILPLAIPIFLGLFGLNGLYRYNLLLGGPHEYGNVFRACSYGILALVFLSYFLNYFQVTDLLSRGWLVLAWVLTILLVAGSRFGWRRVFYWLRRAHGWFITPTLIVGANEHGRAIARQLGRDGAGIRLVGFVDDFLPTGSAVSEGLTVLGTPQQLGELAARHEVEQVIVLPNAVAWETYQEIMEHAGLANGYEVQLSPGFYEILTASVEVTHRAFVPLLRVRPARITGLDLMLKTGLDYGLGAVLVVLALPLMLPIALAIWLVEGRPVLERHEMLGLGGRVFSTHKFRTGLGGTMRRRLGGNRAEKVADCGQARPSLFRFLYCSGLDKLPQLFDVLAGRMSLVGPRTVSVSQDVAYRRWLPRLLTVKPGWLGPWAVTGPQTVEAELRLALYYVRNWTIWLDLEILFRVAKELVRPGAAKQRRIEEWED